MKKHARTYVKHTLFIIGGLFLFSVLMGSRVQCEVQDPPDHVVVVEETYVPPPVKPYGDIYLNYDINGHSCNYYGIEAISFTIQASNGEVMFEDWGVECDTFARLNFYDLPFGSYYVEILGYDRFNRVSVAFGGYIEHVSSITDVFVDLMPTL